MADKELEAWEEDRDRVNRMAEYAQKKGLTIPVLGGTDEADDSSDDDE